MNQCPNILIVDDEPYICNIISDALAGEGCNTLAVSDPAEALHYVHTSRIDLVLSDLMMGEFSGEQILDATLAEHPDAIVILMTAHPTVQTAISVLKRGAFDFLVKPFKLEMLRATIRRGLEHQRILRENLQLKEQVEFLRVAAATGTRSDLQEFLGMVARSCRKETLASAVGIIRVDQSTHEPDQEVFAGEDDTYRSQVLEPASVASVIQNGLRPVVHSERIDDDGEHLRQTFVTQPIIDRDRLLGVINLLVRARFGSLTPGQFDILGILASSAASAIANDRLYRDLKGSYLQAIRGLANAVEARDQCTAGHTDRVCRLAELMGQELGWTESQLEGIVMGCTLHDIGKIGVPDRILNKPGAFTEDELKQMRSHPDLGRNIIDGIDLFQPAMPYVVAHHEHYDGSGYPHGLKGDEIPVEGRLLAVVDTFDAILSDRPYRDGSDLRTAVGELIKYSGSQFDPAMVRVFLKVLKGGQIDFKAMFGRSESLDQLDDIELPATEKVSV